MNIQFLGADIPVHMLSTREEVDQAIEYFSEIKTPIAIDIETAPKAGYTKAQGGGLQPHVTEVELMQLSDGKVVYMVNSRVLMQPLLESLQGKSLVAHNAIFELKHLRQFGVDLNIGCTMILSCLYERATNSPAKVAEEDYDPEDDDEKVFRGFGLKDCAGRYLNLDLSKTEQTSDWSGELTEEQLIYAAMDVLVCLKIAGILAPKVFNALKMKKLYDLLKEMQHVVVDMEVTGMGFDRNAHNKLISIWEAEANQAKSEAHKYFKDVNLRSNKQMGEWLERTYPSELDTWPKTEKGAYAFGEVAMIDKSHLEPTKKLRASSHISKRLSTYGYRLAENHINPVTNRIHAGYNIGETRTGRMSSSNPNAQQYPRDNAFRKLFVPAEGNVLVVADFSQIEVRVQAELSKDPFMRQVYAQGRDIYVELAKKITMKEITDDNDRHIGKTCVLALAYGMGAKKLVMYAKRAGLDLGLDEAYDCWNTYHDTFKVYSAWCDSVREQARRCGYVRTVTGKVRRLYESELYTRGPNTLVQGAAFELFGLAACKIRKRLEGLGIIVGLIHDEIIIECPEVFKVPVKAILEIEMSEAMKEMFPNASSFKVAEAYWGDNWLEAKKGPVKTN